MFCLESAESKEMGGGDVTKERTKTKRQGAKTAMRGRQRGGGVEEVEEVERCTEEAGNTVR